MAHVDGKTIDHTVSQAVAAAIHQVVGYGVVVAFGVLLCQVLGKDVVAGGGQSVGAHAAVVAMLVGGLSC